MSTITEPKAASGLLSATPVQTSHDPLAGGLTDPLVAASAAQFSSVQLASASILPVQAQNFTVPKGGPLKDAGKWESSFDVPQGSFSSISVAENQGNSLSNMGAKAATQSGNIAIQGSQASDSSLSHELGHAAENLKSRGSITAAPAPMAGTNICAPNTSDEAAADRRGAAAASKMNA